MNASSDAKSSFDCSTGQSDVVRCSHCLMPLGLPAIPGDPASSRSGHLCPEKVLAEMTAPLRA
jgi:hypothetical protein